jgi:hypothetical protein
MMATTDPPTINDEAVATTVIDRLVEHYNQAVHEETDFASGGPRIIELSSTTNEDESFYRDGHLSPLPPVVQHLLSCLLDIQAEERRIFSRLLQAYPTCIRPTFFVEGQVRIRGISVLKHYELLLRQYLVERQDSSPKEEQRTLETTALPLASVVEGGESISGILELIISDLTLLTAWIPSFDNGISQASKRIVLSSLWGLVQLGLLFPVDENTVRRCITSLLPFGELLDMKQVDAQLPETLCNVWRHCAYPPPKGTLSMLVQAAEEPMDWDKFTSDGSSWTLVPVQNVWKQLLRMETPAPSNREIQRAVLTHTGWVAMATALRAHFFGRDMAASSQQLVQPPRYRLHLGHRVAISALAEQEERERNMSDNRPYKLVPSRLHAVLHFLSLLEAGDVADASLSQFLTQLMPICYELLSAHDDITIGKGAVVLFRLLNVLASTNVQEKELIKPLSQTTNATHYGWSAHADNLLTALDTVIKTCRDGCTLVIVGLAQRELLRQLAATNNVNDKYQMKRRQATQQWFLILNSIRHNPPDPKLAWGILVTLISILYDHVQQENADCVELGRLGLKAILPLVRLYHEMEYSAHGPQIPVLALATLSNLLVAAHPIMPRHANKIICELVACLGRIVVKEDDDDTMEADKTEDPAKALLMHVTAMSLVICGETADSCVGRIFQPEFDGRLHACLDEVRTLATSMPS